MQIIVSSCEICGWWYEDRYHATMVCPHAVALCERMSESWRIPEDDDLNFSGPEWLLILLDKYTEVEVANLLMVMWRSWFVRNRITRSGKQVSVDDSVQFL